MSLKKLKFSGFKSFAETTIIDFPTNLNAVVGPNGCGKSNIVDGIRWVIGEISFKQLRGQNMSDVIFNGTEKRNAMGQAIAEITFDNSNNMLGGEYAKYNEILIRREVTRDGGSDYFINNTRCRRKDIVDMFLGTGLGSSQNYAIIEQGMIAKIIEAKPDDLRLLIEETAGISKYKDRRKATERRMEQTKENLSRLNDIRTEIESQLKVLKKQANAASYYQKLRKDERNFIAKIDAFNWQLLNNEVIAYKQKIMSFDTNLNAKIATQRNIESTLEELKQKEISAEENFNNLQSNFYKLNSEIAQLEQRIHYNRSRASELKNEQEKIENEKQETLDQKQNDSKQQELLSSEIEKLQNKKAEAKELLDSATTKLKEHEEKYERWQEKWEKFSQNYSELSTSVEVGETKLHYLQQNSDKVATTLSKLNQEKGTINVSVLNDAITALADSKQNFGNEIDQKKALFQKNQQDLISLRQKNNETLNDLDNLKENLQKLLSKETQLKTLQKAAFGKNQDHAENWLKEKDLDQNRRLLKELKVEPKWETALETVLHGHLDAVCVDKLDSVIPHLSTQEALFDLSFLSDHESVTKIQNGNVNLPLLTAKVSNVKAVHSLLNGIYAANDINQALSMVPNLHAYESIITMDGLWFGPNWVKVQATKKEQDGILQREKELKEITSQISTLRPQIGNLDGLLKNNRSLVSELEPSQIKLQHELEELNHKLNSIQHDLTGKEHQLQTIKQRETLLINDIAHQVKMSEDLKTELDKIQSELGSNKELIQSKNNEQKTLQIERDQVKASLEEAETFETEQRQNFSDAERRLEIITKEIGYLQQNFVRSEKRLSTLNERNNSVSKALEEVLAPESELAKELEQNLEKKLKAEAEVSEAKKVLNELNENVRELERNCKIIQEEAQEIRSSLERTRILEEGAKVKSGSFSEKIASVNLNLDELLQELFPSDEEAGNEKEAITLDKLQGKLERVQKRIENLGPINLTAIDEYEKQEERKNYLDAQNEDLIAALNTLQNAIYKIDHETKSKFKETFADVNKIFTALFPKVFNGGKAILRLSGDDLLTSGVEVFAQPPGKRNTSIHLLSGGEKTLTAIALIFSMFQLNPAPFCLLDEVDAPLDDENVNRFCNLVKEMAKDVQFIYITHNKITMEMADQLLGVTMKEAGVSRIVSVDIKQALDLAEQ